MRALSTTLLIGFLFLGGIRAQQVSLGDVEELLARERPQAALRALRRVAERGKEGKSHARLRLEAHRLAGQPERVAAFAPDYVERHPDDVEVQVWLGDALIDLSVGEGVSEQRAAAFREQALEVAEGALRARPDDLGAFDLELRALAWLARSDEAVALGRAAIEKAPEKAQLYLVLAEALEVGGEPGEAIGVLHAAAQRAPKDARFPTARGEVHWRASQHEEAGRAFNTAVRCAELDPETAALLGEYVWLAFAQYRDFAGAEGMVEGWLETHPKHPRAHWWAGYLRELQGDLEGAAKSYAAAWRLSDHKLGDAALHLGLLAQRRDDAKTALPLLGAAIALGARPRPGTLKPQDAINALAQPHFVARRLKQAAEILEKYAVANDPYDPILQQNLGFVLREWGSLEAARKMKTRALALWKRSAKHYTRAAEEIVESDQPDLRKAQVLNDTGLMYHYHLGKRDEGIRWYERALDYDPRYIDALENLGRAWFEKKDYAQAILWFDRALEVDPQRALSRAGREQAAALLAQKKN
jgi:tetratricopeptide (TPR) repeat protein